VAAAAAWLAVLLPPPWGPADRAALLALRWRAAAVPLLLAVVWAALLALLAWRRCPIPGMAEREEPLLGPLHVMPCRSSRPVLALAGLDAGVGVSTIAFNLAVTMAVDGRVLDGAEVRTCRPICLLANGTLADALGLGPRPLEDYLARHPHRVDADLVNLAVRHPSGCELLCLGGEGPSTVRLATIAEELRQRYDVVLIDGGRGGRHFEDLVCELGDPLLLVGQPDAATVRGAGRWIERVWALGLEGRTALLLNRMPAWPPPPLELELAFLHGAELPDDSRVATMDREGMPWSLDRRLWASRRLVGIAAQLLPALVPGPGADAA
jgi:hypothetical protein